MTKEKPDPQIELLEQLLETTQNLFILQALEAGIKSDDVRALLHIDKHRVSRVSKIRKKREADK